jgi:exopolysaccharide production protein ExoQ
MNPNLATLLFTIGVLGLFWLDRDFSVKTSKALWIPIIWVLIAGSRPVSQWLASGPAQAMTNADQYLEGNPFDRVIFSGLLLLGLIVLARRGSRVVKLLRSNPAIVLFFTYCLVSVLWSDYTDVSFKRWVKAFSDLVMIVIVLTDLNPLAATKRLLARVGFILVPASVLLIKYYPALGRKYNIWTWTPMYVGVADHKNTLGMIVMVLAIGFVWRFLLAYGDIEDPNRVRQMVAHASLIGMSIWLFSQAQSMTGQATFALASVFLIATSFAFVVRKRWLVQLAVFFMVTIPACTLLLGIGGSALEELGKDATLTGRTDIWKLVIGMAGNPLLGTGFESFWLGSRANRMWNLYYFHPTQAHNGYIEVYLELGWIGIVLLAAVIVAAYRNALATLQTNPDLGRIRMAFIAVALVYNVTEAGFRMMTLTWIVLLLSAIILPETAAETAPSPLPAETTPKLEDWQHQGQTVPNFARRRREAI